MVKYKRTAKVCLLTFISVLLLLSTLGCVEEDKEISTPVNNPVNTEKTESNIEGLKKEAAKLEKQIEKASEIKTNDTVLSDEEKQKELKRLEDMEAKLLEQSKEIEEKIKELQKKGN
ncbi:MAG TPA: hypothetical protein VEB00_10795 [Clostridia bacterium]|nr:hypothetical protein [Clostridia bacterium]